VSDYTSIAVEGTVRSPTLTSYNLDSRSPQSEEQQRLVGAVFKTSHVVRRLTPIECERLQGFPDNYTRIPWRGKPAEKCPDGPRYKVLGNSMAVPVMKWIAMGIQAVDEVLDELEDRPTSVNIRQPSIFEF
jgi:DNA (cytosine-5)-methyltransferase 1